MAVFFDGASRLGLSAEGAGIDMTQAATTFCWARVLRRDPSFVSNTLMARWQETIDRNWLMDSSLNGVTINILDSANTGRAATSGTVESTPIKKQWFTAAATFDGNSSTLYAYLDGVRGAASVFSPNVLKDSNTPWTLGGRAAADTFTPLYGYMAHAAIWSLALSPEEVMALALGASPLSIRRSALQSYWPLTVEYGVRDIGGGDNHLLVLTGRPRFTPDDPIFEMTRRPFMLAFGVQLPIVKAGFLDIVQGVATPTAAGIEAPKGIASTFLFPYSLTKALTVALATSVEFLQVIQTASGDPLEALQRVAATSGDPVESTAPVGVSQVAALPIESLLKIAKTGGEAFEALQTLYSGNPAVPQTSVLDSFDRPDENPLNTSNWDFSSTSGHRMQVVGQAVTGTAVGSNSGMAWIPAGNVGPDCEAFCTISALPASTANLIHLQLRNGYLCRLVSGQIRLIANFNSTSPWATASYTIQAGDVVVYRIIGNTHYVYVNGSLVLQASPTGGNVSNATGRVQFDVSDTTTRLDNAGGGTVVASYAGVRAADVIDALRGLSAVGAESLEAQATTASTSQALPLETLRLLAIAGSASAYEALREIDAAGAANALETLRMLAIVGLADPYEALKKLAVTGPVAVDVLKSLAIAGSVDAIETLKVLAVAGNVDALEALQTIALASTDPVDTQQNVNVSQTALLALEALRQISASGGSNWLEALEGLRSTTQDALEALQVIATTASDPIDTQSNVNVTQTAALAYETLQSLAVLAVNQADVGQMLRSLAADPFESLRALVVLATTHGDTQASVTQSGVSNVEWLQTAAGSIGAWAEVLRGISNATGASFESLLGLAISRILPADASQQLATLAVARAESLQRSSATTSTQEEALGTTDATTQLVAEALQSIRQFFGDPLESQNQSQVSGVASLPLETLLGLAITGISSAESDQSVQASTQYPVEVGRGIAALYAAPYEALLGVSATGAAALDALRNLASSGQLSAESLLVVSHAAVEIVEALVGLRTTVAAPLSALQTIRATIGAPEETQAIGSVSQIASMPFEALQLISHQDTAIAESGQGVESTIGAAYEALRALGVTGAIRAESVKPISNTGTMVAELKQALQASAGSDPLEALGGLQGRITSPAEAIATLSLLARLNLDTQGTAIRAMALLPLEALQATSASTAAPWEFFIFEREGIVVLVDAATAEALLADEATSLALLTDVAAAGVDLDDELANWLGLTDESTGSAVLSDGED